MEKSKFELTRHQKNLETLMHAGLILLLLAIFLKVLVI